MSEKFELDGKEYEFTGNPSLGTVRKVQSMQMNVIRDYVSEKQLKEMDSLEDEGAIIEAILDSGGLDALQNVMWDRSMLEPAQTISLAVDEHIDPSKFDEMKANDFKEAKKSAEEVLDGTAEDFFNDLGIGLSMGSNEMKRRATKMAANET